MGFATEEQAKAIFDAIKERDEEREARRENDEPAYWMWNGRKYYYDHPAADDDFRDEQ